MNDTYPSPSELKGAIRGTLIYISLYMVFIQFQAYSKFYIFHQKKKEVIAKDDGMKTKVSFRAVKYYNSKDMLALNGDRTVGNFVEFAFVFLSLLWIHAIFVNPNESFTIAVLYTFFRSLYPILFNQPLPGILLSTVPMYIILAYMFCQIIFKVAI